MLDCFVICNKWALYYPVTAPFNNPLDIMFSAYTDASMVGLLSIVIVPIRIVMLLKNNHITLSDFSWFECLVLPVFGSQFIAQIITVINYISDSPGFL